MAWDDKNEFSYVWEICRILIVGQLILVTLTGCLLVIRKQSCYREICRPFVNFFFLFMWLCICRQAVSLVISYWLIAYDRKQCLKRIDTGIVTPVSSVLCREMLFFYSTNIKQPAKVCLHSALIAVKRDSASLCAENTWMVFWQNYLPHLHLYFWTKVAENMYYAVLHSIRMVL